MPENSVYGLTTQEALGRLYEDISELLRDKEWDKRQSSWFYDSLFISNSNSTLSWPSVLAISLSSITLFVVSTAGDETAPRLTDSFTIIAALAVGLMTVFWDARLRHSELFRKAQQLADSICRMQTQVSWNTDNYPHISSPTSPCITLQWTWRDGQVVNLPWALLVRGDVILMRPGQTSPGLCSPLEDKDGHSLHPREIFNPQMARDGSALPSTRAPLENKLFMMQETPYLRNLHMVLEQSLRRPLSYHDKERHLMVTRCIEHMAFPIVVTLVLFMNYARRWYFAEWSGKETWAEALLVQPINAGLPLLPLTFPLMWRLVNSWGFTKLRALLQDTTPNKVALDPFEDAAAMETNAIHISELWNFYRDDLFGRGPLLCRSVNVLHVLGSVTALCCVDKKGVLSWPNPTAEKVFFLRRSGDETHSRESLCSEGYDSQRRGSTGDETTDAILNESGEEVATEVLDLTHDHTSPFRLHFDDPSWKQHLSSLKPLGLAILLNTCNANSQETYSQFCCHLMCEASQSESLVPVTNRRCLCELPAQIGFMEHAQDGFTLEQLLCTFQHAKTESVKRDIKFAKQLSKSTKLKFPFPHMVATVLRDKQTGCLQLMSQGTADVILESCVEFWDGVDLHPLTACDRKKILDFYQRSSLTANCTAFAYRPLSKTVSPKMSQMYLELPSESRHLYLPYRSPTPLALSMLDSKWRGVFGQFHSSDSLLGVDGKEEEVSDIEGWVELQCNQVFVGMVTMQYQAQADVVHLVEQLERACIRFVHFSKENELRSRVFSEKMGLESGWNCHISLLTDRTRSEGEASVAGSHGDLQHAAFPVATAAPLNTKTSHVEIRPPDSSDRCNLTTSRAMSFSAPSAINLDMTTVKFDDDQPTWNPDLQPSDHLISQGERRGSQGSNELQEDGQQWRSLSCLTDSTESVPFGFDIANRAKLPRGIENIRPHLELIDNVPLLVSLFTDCTSSATREMLQIMQDYGEVVCVFGSSANCENAGLFLQADASIAVEPLYPQVCQKHPVFSAPTPCSGPSPVELSRALNSLPCAVSMRREDPLSMFQLITCARDFCLSLRNFLQFWLCSMSSISVLLVFAALFMLPPPLNTGQVLFLCCLLVPLLAASLTALPTDPQVMYVATGKNQCLVNVEVISFVFWCYGLKCLPSIFLVCCFYVSGLSFFCFEAATATNTTCAFVYPQVGLEEEPNKPSDMPGWSQYRYTLLFLQHCCAVLLVLHLVATSASYIHRDRLIWQSSPFRHLTWVCVSIAVSLLQLVYAAVSLSVTSLRDISSTLSSVNLPWPLVLSSLASPLLVVLTNEAVKWQEIKVNQRFQRRQRLDFGTKLGMNSPF